MPDAKPHAYIQPITVKPRIARPQPKGLPLINLGFNEAPYPPSPAVMSAIQAATNNANSYGNPKCEQLRTALGSLIRRVRPGWSALFVFRFHCRSIIRLWWIVCGVF